MKSILTALLLIVGLLSYSQTLQNYSGSIDDGIATYQYYENDQNEKILHGNFSCEVDGWKITGQNNNNLRDGIWQATRTKKSINSLVTATYKKGNIEGRCTLINTDIKTGRVILKNEATFKNNIQVGEFTITGTTNDMNILMNLDPDGFADGTSTFKWSWGADNYELLVKYHQGIELAEVYKKLNTKEILNQYENNDFNSATDLGSFVRTSIDFPWEDGSLVGQQILFWQTESINPLCYIKEGCNKIEFKPEKIIRQ